MTSLEIKYAFTLKILEIFKPLGKIASSTVIATPVYTLYSLFFAKRTVLSVPL